MIPLHQNLNTYFIYYLKKRKRTLLAELIVINTPVDFFIIIDFFLKKREQKKEMMMSTIGRIEQSVVNESRYPLGKVSHLITVNQDYRHILDHF